MATKPTMKRAVTLVSMTRQITQTEEKTVRDILKYLEQDEVNEVQKKIGKICDVDMMSELMRQVVSSRNDVMIKNMLKVLNAFLYEDQVDGKEEGSSLIPASTPEYRQSLLRSMLVLATLNDDPSTLSTIANSDCAIKVQQSTSPRQLNREISVAGESSELVVPVEVGGHSLDRHRNPMLVACTQGYPECVSILYKAGYRFNMYEEDEKFIQRLTSLDHAKAISSIHYLYERMYFGEKSCSTISQLPKKKLVSMDSSTEFDPVERFIRFRAYASPTYISTTFQESDFEELDKVDPLRKTIACSTYAEYLGEYYPQQQAEYQQIAEVCEQYAEDILDQCQNNGEVKTILNYSNTNTWKQSENTNWSIALLEKNKPLVGHHYFQKFLWDKMTGGDLDWHKYHLRWKVVIMFISLLCFIFSPVVIIIDLFRDADILFVPPKKTKKKRNIIQHDSNTNETVIGITEPDTNNEKALLDSEEHETKFFRFFREKFHQPLFRVSVALMFEIIFLVVLSLALVDPWDEEDKQHWWWYDTLTCLFSVLYLVENFADIYRAKWMYFRGPWNLSSLGAHLLIVMGCLVHAIGFLSEDNDKRNEWSGNHPANIGATMLSLGATLAIIRTLRWLRLIKSIGPMVICINKMMNDIYMVLILFGVLLLAFSLGLTSMFKPFRGDTDRYIGGLDDNAFQHNRFDTNDNIFSTMFWRFLEPGQPVAAYIYRFKNETRKEEYLNKSVNLSGEALKDLKNEFMVKSLQFSHIMGIILWAAYQFFVVIVSMNLLIALMNATYSKLTLHADKEWKYHTAVVYNTFLTRHSVLPPPLRPFYYLAYIVRQMGGLRAVGSKEQMSDRKTYWELMTKLIKRKIQADIEKSRDDNFADMKKDIKNIIQNEVVKKLDDKNADDHNTIEKFTRCLSQTNNEYSMKLDEKVKMMMGTMTSQNEAFIRHTRQEVETVQNRSVKVEHAVEATNSIIQNLEEKNQELVENVSDLKNSVAALMEVTSGLHTMVRELSDKLAMQDEVNKQL